MLGLLNKIKQLIKKQLKQPESVGRAYQTFAYSMWITYSITLGMAAFALFATFDGTSDWQKSSYAFNVCSKLNWLAFTVATVVETLPVTTITFAGTILVLQSDWQNQLGNAVKLFICIALLAISGFGLATIKTFDFLIVDLLLCTLLSFFALRYSWNVIGAGPTHTWHKAEPDDGNLCFR